MPADKLTPKQKRFCEEYIIDLNATQAAIRAGYSDNSGKQIANENLTKPDVQEYIQELIQKREKRTEITADKVIKELAHIAFDDISNYLQYRTERVVTGHNDDGTPIQEYRTIIDLKDSDTIDTRSISEVQQGSNGQFKFKMYCKDNALVQLGKHLGLFVDKVEATNTNLNTDLSNMTAEERKKRIEELTKKMQDIK
jgi:phage terminase small subunit